MSLLIKWLIKLKVLFKLGDKIALGVYPAFSAIWIVIWAVLWFTPNLLHRTCWLWIPFGFGLGYLTFTGYKAWKSPLCMCKPQEERELLKWVTDYLTAFIFAITIVMLVGVYLCGSPTQTVMETIKGDPTLSSFYRFEFLALGFLFLFVFPTYWCGGSEEEQLKCLRTTRHVKTASYLIAIFFCLAGLVELAKYIFTAGG